MVCEEAPAKHSRFMAEICVSPAGCPAPCLGSLGGSGACTRCPPPPPSQSPPLSLSQNSRYVPGRQQARRMTPAGRAAPKWGHRPGGIMSAPPHLPHFSNPHLSPPTQSVDNPPAHPCAEDSLKRGTMYARKYQPAYSLSPDGTPRQPPPKSMHDHHVHP